MKKFAVFDIDGTIFRSSLFIEIVYELARRELIKLPKTEHHEAYTNWADRKDHGYTGYINKMVEVIESQLEGIKVSDFESASDAVLEARADRVYVYSRKLIKQLKSENYFLIALSGSQSQLVARFAEHWGFDASVGQTYFAEDGLFTGKINKTHYGKEKLLQPLIEQHDLSLEDSLAMGDTEGDISMLEMVQRPIAFNPNRELYKHSVKNGWEIIVERKDMIYKFGPGSSRNYELIDTE